MRMENSGALRKLMRNLKLRPTFPILTFPNKLPDETINRVEYYWFFEPSSRNVRVTFGLEVHIENESESFRYDATYTCGETKHVVQPN